MSRITQIVLLAATFALANCERSDTGAASEGSDEPTRLTAATLGDQTILSAGDYLTEDKFAMADTSRGEALAMQCRACHTLEDGGANMLGPNLFGVFGRPAGSVADYPYSAELAAGGFIWTPRALDAWLAQPFAFLPGNRMSYPGLQDGNDRNAVIAYLLRHTTGGDNKGT